MVSGPNASLPLASARAKAKPQCRHLRTALGNLNVIRLRRSDAPVSVRSPFIFAQPRRAGAVCARGRPVRFAQMGETISPAFADPAKYDLYDCKQLEVERKTIAARAAELQGLMSKAETGVAGSVVAEVAYRNDYIAVRGQSKLAEEAWRKNRCHESKPDANAAAPTPPTIKPAPAVRGSRPKTGGRN